MIATAQIRNEDGVTVLSDSGKDPIYRGNPPPRRRERAWPPFSETGLRETAGEVRQRSREGLVRAAPRGPPFARRVQSVPSAAGCRMPVPEGLPQPAVPGNQQEPGLLGAAAQTPQAGAERALGLSAAPMALRQQPLRLAAMPPAEAAPPRPPGPDPTRLHRGR